MQPTLAKLLSRSYTWLTERLYHEFAWAYDLVSWIVSFGKWDAIRKLALAHLSGGKILEIGYGTGELLLSIDTSRHNLYGLEFSSSMRKQARKKQISRKKEIPCIGGEAGFLPLADSSIDTIVSTFPSGYILEQSTWSEASRVLQNPTEESGGSGGQFVIVGIVVFIRSRDRSKPLVRKEMGGGVIARCERLAEAARLKPRLIYYTIGIFEVPVLIAEKYRYNDESIENVWYHPNDGSF